MCLSLSFTALQTEVRKQDDTRFPEDVSKLMKIYFNVTYEIPLTEEELAEQREQQNSNSGTSSSSSSSGKLVADIEPGIPGNFTSNFKVLLFKF